MIMATYLSPIATELLLHTGILWPLQSLDKWLRIFSRLTFITFPAEGVRTILMKGDIN